MKRREFLRNLSVVGGAAALSPSMGLAAGFPGLVTSGSIDAKDRVLVLIYLNGGNDGLNTFIPLDIYDDLKPFRPDIIIPENRILPLTSNLGVHPSLSALKELFDKDELGVIRDVGYEEANLSHFRSREIIDTGSNSNEQLDTGWLGRHLQEEIPSYPEGFPNLNFPDPIVLAMSSSSSQNTQGALGNYNVVAGNPASKNNFDLDDLSEYEAPSTRYGEELDFLRTSAQQTNSYKESIYQRYTSGPELVDATDNNMANQLKDVARLIAGGSTTKVFLINQGGYDTHGGQVEGGDTVSGKHADLLKEMSDAIGMFLEDLETLKIKDRVVGLTYTEFGRRITMNESLGTDHGHASTWFAFGAAVNPVVHGKTTVLPDVIDNKANVEFQNEFHDVYYSILTEWLGAEAGMAASYFGESTKSLNIIKPEEQATNSLAIKGKQQLIQSPKIFENFIIFNMILDQGQNIEVSIHDLSGRLIHQQNLGYYPTGANEIRVDKNFKQKGRFYYLLNGEHIQTKGSLHLR